MGLDCRRGNSNNLAECTNPNLRRALFLVCLQTLKAGINRESSRDTVIMVGFWLIATLFHALPAATSLSSCSEEACPLTWVRSI